MKVTTQVVMASVFALAAFANAADKEDTVYRDGFDHYGDHCAQFSAPCSINELPPSLKHLSFVPTNLNLRTAAAVYTKNRTIPAADCRNYDFAFRFMFPAREGKRSLETELFTSSDGKAVQRYGVTIDEDKYAISLPPGTQLLDKSEPKAGDAILPIFPSRQWHQAVIRVRGRNMSLYIGDKIGMRKMASAEYSGDPLTAFNFRSATPFSIDDIAVTQHENQGAQDFVVDNGVSTATHNAEYAVDVPAGSAGVSAEVRLGNYPGQMKVSLKSEQGDVRTITSQTFSCKQKRTAKKDVPVLSEGKLVTTNKYVDEDVILPDAGFDFSCSSTNGGKKWSLRWYARPLLQWRYEGAEAAALVDDWNNIPSASERFITVDIRPKEGGVGIWIEGNYAADLQLPATLKRVSFVLPAGGSVRNVQISKAQHGLFLPLDVSKTAHPGAMEDAKIRGAPGDNVIEKIPFHVVDGAGNADTGICEENQGSYFLECDGYLQRSAFEGNMHSILFAVPVAQYIRAWALCAVEDDAGKDTEITARLTRFLGSGQGPAIADTTLVLPRSGASSDDRIRQVGTVEAGGKSLPLYLVRFDIDSGSIQDLIFQNGNERLDFEFVGKLHDGDNFYMDMKRKPSLTKKSGVHVFGATLERSPFEFCVLPERETNVYRPGETPAMNAAVTAANPGTCTLEWVVRDIDGKELEKGSHAFAFAKAGEKSAYRVTFGPKEFGWYGVTFRLSDSAGNAIKHDAAFALIDADKRKAGYESPYFIWNYNGAGGNVSETKVICQMLKDMGVHRTLLGNHPESDFADDKLTLGQFAYLRPKGKTEEEVLAEVEPKIRDLVARYPHCEQALIFHESGGGPFPKELFGEKTELTDDVVAGDKEYTARAIALAKAWRKVAPQIKLSIGNSGESIRLVARLFREKFPRELIDFTGDESGGGTSVLPERGVAGAFWNLRELARLHGYDGVEPTACYEWSTRRLRHNGPRKNAEYRIRDSLVALAWNSRLIPLTTLSEGTSGYYNTVWNEAAVMRPPLLYPLPVFPAIATLTQVLDGAQFRRMLPTGSATVYALEFSRGDELIHVLWTARGEVESRLTFETDTQVKRYGFYGAQSVAQTTGAKLNEKITEAPIYLVGTTALRAVDIAGKRTFEREPVPANGMVACTLGSLEGWRLVEGFDDRLANDLLVPEFLGGRRPGKFALQAVKDDERGDCLELIHTSAAECPPMMYEYVMIQNTKPVPVAGQYSTLGLWVKGNSSWSKVFWEIEDAEGERWTASGTGGYGCNAYDWADKAGVDFDGWHLLQFPLTTGSPVTVSSPGSGELQWQHDGRGNHAIDFPIAITGIGVAVPGKTLNLKEMEPVKANLRFSDIIVN